MKLLPCPFCGENAEHGNIAEDCTPPHPDQGGYFIQCCNNACGASTNLRFAYGDDPKPLLAEQWNRRTENVQALDELDRIAGALGMQDTDESMVEEIEKLLSNRRRPVLTERAIELLQETAEAERIIGDRRVATALDLLLEWHGAETAPKLKRPFDKRRLTDALAGMCGLIELVVGRADMPAEIAKVLRTNHRTAEAIATLAAHGEEPEMIF